MRCRKFQDSPACGQNLRMCQATRFRPEDATCSRLGRVQPSARSLCPVLLRFLRCHDRNGFPADPHGSSAATVYRSMSGARRWCPSLRRQGDQFRLRDNSPEKRRICSGLAPQLYRQPSVTSCRAKSLFQSAQQTQIFDRRRLCT